MDRISGLWPQSGWSPLLTALTPKRAPASTVEPAADSANTQGGMGAEVDRRTPQDPLRDIRMIGTLMAARANAEDSGLASRAVEPPPDPDAPTGPPPTFAVSPLERLASQLMAADIAASQEPEIAPESEPSRGVDSEAAPSAQHGAGEDRDTAPERPGIASPEPSEPPDYPAITTPEPTLDVTR